jgi:transposase
MMISPLVALTPISNLFLPHMAGPDLVLHFSQAGGSLMSKLNRNKRQASVKIEKRPFAGLDHIQPHAAGVDIGAHEIVACVPGPENSQDVRTFGTYTADLHALAAWFQEQGIRSVAMESTGVYWIPLFETLESSGFHCCLISATAIRRFPGRKSDVIDCQWIQTLHSYGLLAPSFRPEADLVALRTLLRHRAQLIEHRSPHILHMQKALLQMNIQLSQALSDVTGKTGQAIIRAIVAGERDPHKLAALRNYRCQKDEAEIAQALTGTWRPEHLFVLQQSLAFFDFYTLQIQVCDDEIERAYSLIRPDWGTDEQKTSAQLPAQKPHSHSKNNPNAATRVHLKRIAGVDLVAVDGISASLAQMILAEAGSDMSQFPNEKHFCSWLSLAPKNDISGGKILKSRTLKSRNRAGQAFRLAAAAVVRADCAFGAFYRRLKSRLGPAQAIVATAHKIARVVYRMLKYKIEYEHIAAEQYDQKFKEREIQYLQRKAARLGFALSPAAPPVTPPVAGAVS